MTGSRFPAALARPAASSMSAAVQRQVPRPIAPQSVEPPQDIRFLRWMTQQESFEATQFSKSTRH
jgi:hypothetical protein